MSFARLTKALFALTVLLACRAQVTEPNDKNTNWLRQCSGSEQCGAGLQCVCGVCTSVCDRDQQCELLDRGAVCTAFSDGSCGSATAPVCTAGCDDDDSCAGMGEGFVCAAGSCVPAPNEPAPPQQDAGPVPDPGPVLDAGPPPDMTTADGGAVAGDPAPIQAAVSSACEPGFVCEARVFDAMPGRDIRSFAVDTDFVWWAEHGSFDELGNPRHDGAIVRMPKAGGPPESVREGLDRPFRMWRDGDHCYWLSGDQADFDQRVGMQTLYEGTLDAQTEPRVVRTGPLLDLQLRDGSMAWLDHFDHETLGEGFNVNTALLEWTDGSYSMSFLAGDYWLATADRGGLYLQHEGGILRVAIGSGETKEIVDDPVVSFPTVDGDKLWVTHTDSNQKTWVAWMPSTGGPVTHVGRAADQSPTLVGTNVVWKVILTDFGDGFEYVLQSIPKSGGEPEAALRWLVPPATPDPDLPLAQQPGMRAALFIADGDDAWVSALDTVIHVHRP